MDYQAVRDGIAANANAISGLNVLGFEPDDGEVPLFYPAEMDIQALTMGRASGRERLIITCKVLVSAADDKSGQQLLSGYLKGSGSTSLRAAIEADKTLGGKCEDLQVVSRSGFRKMPLGSNQYLGAELIVEVVGLGD